MSGIVLTPAGEASASPAFDMPAEAGDWLALLKPRVLTLVVFTAVIGMLVAPGHINPVVALTAVLCITVAAGAAGAINMWFDRDIDALMARTSTRPIPAGRIKPGEALGFGVTLAAAAVGTMYLAANLAAAVTLTLSIAFYIFIYTMWLKRRTPQNIVIGGAAGAFPPLIGWAAVTGSITPMPLLLFAIIFFWTPPHFWALSLYACKEYARAGIPMLPVVAGARETRRQILIYTVLLLPISLLPWWLGYAGAVYGLCAAIFGAVYLATSLAILFDRQDAAGISLTADRPARIGFRVSMVYLFALFLSLGVDHFLG